ncbi:feruloyl esterase b precursor [Moniliophthora roreri MCA 2997]|uniref:Carboxylic ester hydrolase n=1 Tax=Moniliophthora roreri (strain MCA 2997) TaxID=1381753 RepID=V2WAN3_MONRO|nr:feruloyl esterase b precursor [Moniliophthora roreri MCA 2997]
MLLPILGLSFNAAFDFDSACSTIGAQVASIQNASLVLTESVPAGTTLTTFPVFDASCGSKSQVVSTDICRVALNFTTSETSGIYMESWLPRNWTGRFLSTGNGGLGGCVGYGDMAYTSALGFATVGANNGHNGGSGAPFENKLEVLADFVFRSIHTNVVVGKEITRLFYGSPHQKSYYFGCSTGGRQGLKSVQDFPEDFDGVIAGAPAADWNALMGWSGHFLGLTGVPGQPSFIPLDLWRGLISENVLTQCDGIDGVLDGIIEDPNLCNFDPSELLCDDGQTTECLTDTQVETVRGVYSAWRDFEGNVLYPRPQPGAESLAIGFYGGTQFPITADWFHFVVYNTSLDVTEITLPEFLHAIDLDPFNISTFKGDISAFRDRNGKLITYHGQQDGLISPINSERYYERVSSTMGLSPSSLDDFYRFFRISGMSHCAGGTGASQIGGQGSVAGNTKLDPESNILTALVRWVEEGVAPDTILGSKFNNGSLSSGVAFSRRHCRFPFRNTFDGNGDSTKPESWTCVLPA